MTEDMKACIDEFFAVVNSRFDGFEKKLDASFNRIELKLDVIEKKLDVMVNEP